MNVQKKEVVKIRIKKEIKIILVLALLLIFCTALTLAANELTIDSYNGYVGIGTSSPQQKLHVWDASAVRTEVETTATDTSFVGHQITTPAGSWGLYTGAASHATLAGDFGIYDQDGTSYRFVIKDDGNVGIGTSSPSELLSVGTDLGSVTSYTGITVGDSDYAGIFLGNNTNNFGWMQFEASSDSLLLQTKTDGTLYMNTMVLKEGNVGIGTSSPASDAAWGVPALDISGTRGTAILRTTGAGGIATLRMTGPGAAAVDDWHINMVAGADSTLTFNALAGGGVGANILVLKNDGKVGIGTSSPASTLEVAGTARIGLTGSTPLILQRGTGRANFLMDSNVNKLYIDANAGLFLNAITTGNVGIGEASPDSLLHITDTSNPVELKLEGAGADNSFINFIAAGHANPTAYIRMHSTGTGTGELSFSTNTDNGAAPDEAMRIDDTGQVGIGTSSPSSTLDISGTATTAATVEISSHASATGGADRVYLSFGDGGVNKASISYEGDASPKALHYSTVAAGTGVHHTWNTASHANQYSDYAMQLQDDGDLIVAGTIYGDGSGLTGVGGGVGTGIWNRSGTNVFLNNTGDKVGIGTSSPAYTLEVEKSVAGDWVGAFINTDTTNGYGLRVQGGVGETSGALEIKNAAGTHLLYVQGSGEVGIGTDSPNFQLHVHEPSAVGSKLQFTNTDTGTAATDGFVVGIGDGEQGLLWQYENDLIVIATNNIERMRIAADGKVGIGDTSPDANLNVKGYQYIHGPSIGVATINEDVYALQIGPHAARSSTAGTYYPGIAFNHLFGFSSGEDHNTNAPQAWIGLRLYDTPGSERSSLVFATKEGTGVTGAGTDIPSPRMVIDPFGNVGIGNTAPQADLHIGGADSAASASDLILLVGDAPQMEFEDSTTGEDDFWFHINANNFYVLADRNDDGTWDGAYPLQLEADTNIGYMFGNRITTENIDTDTWIATQTCSADYALQSVGKTSKTCINKVDYSDNAYACSADGTCEMTSGSISGALYTATGQADSAIKIGDDVWINDIDTADAFGIVGISNPANGKIIFGSGEDTNIYRSTTNTLKTDDNFIAATLDTGYGANELWDMNQHVLTSSNVQFAEINFGNQELISSDGGSSNIDHIWHDDTPNIWYFNSDTTSRNAAGTSGLKAANIDTGYGAKEIGDTVGNCGAAQVHKGDGGCENENALSVASAATATNADACSADGTCTMQGLAGNDQTIENNYGAYQHIGGWAVSRTATTAVLVNTAYMADRLANNPTDCAAGQFATAIDTEADLTCSAPPWAPTSVTYTGTYMHNGNFGGYAAMYDWIQTRGCAGYHVCSTAELTAWAQTGGTWAAVCFWVNSGAPITDHADTYPYQFADCDGWTQGVYESKGVIAHGSVTSHFSQYGCGNTCRVMCCK